MGGVCSMTGGEEVHTGVWWGNLRKKRLLGRPRCRRENIIMKDLQGVG